MLKTERIQELNNGRFAMFATSGILAAELYTGQVRIWGWDGGRVSNLDSLTADPRDGLRDPSTTWGIQEIRDFGILPCGNREKQFFRKAGKWPPRTWWYLYIFMREDSDLLHWHCRDRGNTILILIVYMKVLDTYTPCLLAGCSLHLSWFSKTCGIEGHEVAKRISVWQIWAQTDCRNVKLRSLKSLQWRWKQIL